MHSNSEVTQREALQAIEGWETLERVMGKRLAEFSKPHHDEEPEGLTSMKARIIITSRIYMIDYQPSPDLCGVFIRHGVTIVHPDTGRGVVDAPLHERLTAADARAWFDRMDIHHVTAEEFEEIVNRLAGEAAQCSELDAKDSSAA